MPTDRSPAAFNPRSFAERLGSELLGYAARKLSEIRPEASLNREAGTTNAANADASPAASASSSTSGAEPRAERSIAEIRSSGAAWVNETELERLCNLVEMNDVTLAQIDAAASIAHDFIYGRNDITQEQASRAIWTIHDIVNSFADATDEAGPPAPMLEEGESVWNIH